MPFIDTLYIETMPNILIYLPARTETHPPQPTPPHHAEQPAVQTDSRPLVPPGRGTG